MVRFVRVRIGSGGASACRRCASSPAEMRSAADVLRDVGSALRGDPGQHPPGIWLAGADAFSHPALPSLIEGAVRAGAARVKLSTDGKALARGENAPGCLHAGVRHVEVTVLGPDASAHDALTGQDGAFDAMSAGIVALQNAAEKAGVALSLTGRIPTCEHDISDVPAAVATLARLGFDSAVIELDPASLDVPAGWAQAVADTGVVNGLWVSFEGMDPVAIGASPLHARAPWVAEAAVTP